MATSTVTCVYRQFLRNICRINRHNLLSNSRALQPTLNKLSYAGFSTDLEGSGAEESSTDSLNNYKMRLDWPTSQVWKTRDFSDVANTFPNDAGLLEVLSENKQGMQLSAVLFYYMMSLKDSSVPWTEQEVVGVLQLLETPRVCITPSEHLQWVNYIISQVKQQGMMTRSIYLNMLYCYLSFNHPFDPVEMLSEIEGAGIDADEAILVCLMKKYVFMNDIENARNIYEFLGSTYYPAISVMVLANTIQGNDEEVEKLIRLYRRFDDEERLQKIKFIYNPLILGNALAGNDRRLRQLEADINKQDLSYSIHYHILNDIQLCSSLGAVESADMLIDYLGRSTKEFYKYAWQCLFHLICNEHYNSAFTLFEKLGDPMGRHFFNQAVRGQMPPEIVMEYAEKMATAGIRGSHFTQYLDCVISYKDRYELMKKVFPVLKGTKIKIRPQDLWYNYLYIKNNKYIDITEIKETLEYHKPDEAAQQLFLFPCLQQRNVKPAEFGELCKGVKTLNTTNCLSLQKKYANFLYNHTREEKMKEKPEVSAGPVESEGVQDQSNLTTLPGTLMACFAVTDKFNTDLDEKMANLQKTNLPRQEVIEVASKLMELGLTRMAVNCVYTSQLEERQSTLDLSKFECSLFDVPVTDENKDAVKRLIEALMRRRYLKTDAQMPSIKMSEMELAFKVIQNYVSFCVRSDDIELVSHLLKVIRTLSHQQTMAIYSICNSLIKQSKYVMLKKVLDIFKNTENVEDVVALSLAATFLEIGQKEKAEKALKKCNVRLHRCGILCHILVADKKVETIQKLCDTLDSVVGRRDRYPDFLVEMQQLTEISGGKKDKFFKNKLQELEKQQPIQKVSFAKQVQAEKS